MKIKIFLTISAALASFASISYADTTMQLTGFGDSATVGNVLLDPYYGTVGGVKNVRILCDDWSNNSYTNEIWQAQVIDLTTVSDSSKGTPMFGNNQALYNELAWLGSQLWANPTNYTTQVEMSFAMWGLAYPYNSPQDSTAPLDYLAAHVAGGTSNAMYIAVQNLIAQAPSHSNFDGSGWEILTPIAGTSLPLSDGIPQEFLTYVPEPASWYGFLALGLAGLVFARRRQAHAAAVRAN